MDDIHIWRNEHGSTLFYVVIILLIVFLLGTAILSTAMTNFHIAVSQNDFEEAYSLAETAAQQAYQSILPIIEQGYQETLKSITALEEDITSQNTLELQIQSKLPSKLNSLLLNTPYFMWNGKTTYYETNQGKTSKAVVSAKLTTGTSSQPITITVKSIAEVGKTKRRVDMIIPVYKTANQYFNGLFTYAAYAEDAITVGPMGQMDVEGNILVSPDKGYVESIDANCGIFVTGGTLHIQGKTYAGNNNIISQDGGILQLEGEVICRTLEANGTGPGRITAGDDVCVYNDIRAQGSDKMMELQGQHIYGVGIGLDDPSQSSAIFTDYGSNVHISRGQFCIGGVEFYSIPSNVDGGIFGVYPQTTAPFFQSPESMGGGNQEFYMKDFIAEFLEQDIIPQYAWRGDAFIESLYSIPYEILPDFALDNSLDDIENRIGKINSFVEKRSNPLEEPKVEDFTSEIDYDYKMIQYQGYQWQYQNYHDDGILVDSFNEGISYARGAVLINGETLYPSVWKDRIDEMDTLLMEKRLEMDEKTDLVLSACIDETIDTQNANAYLADNQLCLQNPHEPFVYISRNPDNINLKGGIFPYNGILYTEGDVTIPPGEEVWFHGIIITRGEINVQGKLHLTGDKGAVQSAMQGEGPSGKTALFFRQKQVVSYLRDIDWKEELVRKIN